MRKKVWRGFDIFWVSLFLLSCSSASNNQVHTVHHIWLYNLHFRRPAQIGAAPRAAYGDEEYESHPKPNAQLDCQPLSDLFKNIDLNAFRSCLQSSNQMMVSESLNYRLHREITPYLALEEDDEADPQNCIRILLNQIPVPREVFFQSNDEGQLNCYSSRVWLSQDVFLGIKDSLSSFDVSINFPLPKIPVTDDETLMLLASWAMMPFWDKSRNGFVSRVVPDDLCQKCIGEKNMFLKGDRFPPLWP